MGGRTTELKLSNALVPAISRSEPGEHKAIVAFNCILLHGC